MPTYQYNCQNCKHQFEQLQKITDNPLKECPKCAQMGLIRGPGGGSGLLFSGSGFYFTDYGPGKKQQSEASGSCCPCGKKESCSS